MTNRSTEILDLVEQIKPILAGQEAWLTGGALAELTSLWLVGHVVAGDRGRTLELHAELLARHSELVSKLSIVNAEALGLWK